MPVYESQLTEGNLKNSHIYITAVLGRLTEPVEGVPAKPPRAIRLEYKGLKVTAEIPKSQHGRPRKFFREPNFVKSFFERTGAAVGDTVLFEEIGPAHFRLDLRKAAVSSSTSDA